MAEADDMTMRQSQLLNRLVIDIETTEELGRLAQFLVDVDNHQLEGFICKRGLLGLETIPVMWVQVESVGRDSILVRQGGASLSERLDRALVLDRQVVLADSGDNVGQLADFCVDVTTGAVTQYLFTAPGWQGLTDGLYTFPPGAVVSAGKKRIMVRRAALDAAPQFVPGVPDRVTELWQKDVSQTRQDVQSAIAGTREVADQVQEQAKKLTGQAKSQFDQVLGQVKKQSRQLRSQVNDRFADAASTLNKPGGKDANAIPGNTLDVDSEEIWPDEDPPSGSL
ncbi:MAG TPA: hypothetical protein V6D02_02070 [Candidatus Obscuribacterales bacterium]